MKRQRNRMGPTIMSTDFLTDRRHISISLYSYLNNNNLGLVVKKVSCRNFLGCYSFEFTCRFFTITVILLTMVQREYAFHHDIQNPLCLIR